ncbi:PilZ domain-containing protein [Desulfosarcina sp.]|uniref:PilZ domain-containing protein n=1 Tax=Desulfosarcina sp. TaxID=2027861 RepID=UPI003563C856
MHDKKNGIKKVKLNLIALFISSMVLMAAVWARQAFAWGVSPHGRYYLTAILIISCILTVITLFRWLRFRHHQPISTDDADQEAAERHRQHYRVQFDESSHPLFVQRTDERHAASQFTCPVRDISETGISLVCTGIYALGKTVQGEIIFGSGRTAPVNGMVIREEAGLTCLRLHCTIDPPLLMAEQREQIACEKGNIPRPAVSNTLLDTATGPLPSHFPRGICRLKRR